jgi:hypothetical protein
MVSACAWIFLGGTIVYRTDEHESKLGEEVGQLWGKPLTQRAPWAVLKTTQVVNVRTPARQIIPASEVKLERPVVITQTDINLDLELDQRRKGLLWYSTYRSTFSGNYVLENPHSEAGELVVHFTFPAADGLYDEFKFEIDGKPATFTRQDAQLVMASIPCEPRSRRSIAINYRSQGLDRFSYEFGNGISEVKNFKLTANTDFAAVDFPGNTLSPTFKQQTDKGWELVWSYNDLISGNGIGIEMPQRLNPGPMASRISFFAPVSLGFFFFLIFIVSVLKGIEIHPVNYFFLAASFFAFHLLLAYLVDHLSIHVAFAICSAVSLFLAVSYMRIVVGNRFAFMEVALAQIVYLVGFSYAFFFEGFTGLTVTIGAILTLFVIMQLTARTNWAARFKGVGQPGEAALASGPTPTGILELSASEKVTE